MDGKTPKEDVFLSELGLKAFLRAYLHFKSVCPVAENFPKNVFCHPLHAQWTYIKTDGTNHLFSPRRLGEHVLIHYLGFVLSLLLFLICVVS